MQTDGVPRVPSSLRHDSVITTIWATLMLLAPPLWTNPNKPFEKRLWEWRYIYLGYAVATVVFFHHGLLAGDVSYLFLIPFAHAVAVVTVTAGLSGLPIPGVEFPIVSDGVVAVLFLTGIIAIIIFEVLNRLYPDLLVENRYTPQPGEYLLPMARLDNRSENASEPPTLDKDVSTAFIGETGSGKTTAMQSFATQLSYDEETAVIAHDVGQEFQQFFEEQGFDVLRLSAEGGGVTWNLFRDAQGQKDFRELASSIFGEEQGYDPFFDQAKQAFTALLVYLQREATKNAREDKLSHLDVVRLLNKPRGVLKDSLERYHDLQFEAGYLDAERGKGAANVYGTIHEHVAPVFVDDFAEYGSFSLEDYIENPDGQVLVIDSNPARMETLGPMFQVILDWSIRYAMSSDTPSVYILDEIDQLPPSTQLGNLAARGRSEQTRSLIGVQTVGQLTETYDAPSAILGNCPQGVYFGPGDQETTEYVLDEIGEFREMSRSSSFSASRSANTAQLERARDRESYREEDRHPITSGTLKQFEPGECVVKSRTKWWLGAVHHREYIETHLQDPTTGTLTSLDVVRNSVISLIGAVDGADPETTDAGTTHEAGGTQAESGETEEDSREDFSTSAGTTTDGGGTDDDVLSVDRGQDRNDLLDSPDDESDDDTTGYPEERSQSRLQDVFEQQETTGPDTGEREDVDESDESQDSDSSTSKSSNRTGSESDDDEDETDTSDFM